MSGALWAIAALCLSGPSDLATPLDDAPGAVALLLTENAPAAPGLSLAEGEAGDAWDGSLIGGIGRSLFWGYRFLFSSQDSISCGFEPSCSHFAQLAIEQHGILEGGLAAMDRLTRDSPLSIPFYPLDLETGLMKDPPDHYCLFCRQQ